MMIARLALALGKLPSEVAAESPVDILTLIDLLEERDRMIKESERGNRR